MKSCNKYFPWQHNVWVSYFLAFVKSFSSSFDCHHTCQWLSHYFVFLPTTWLRIIISFLWWFSFLFDSSPFPQFHASTQVYRSMTKSTSFGGFVPIITAPFPVSFLWFCSKPHCKAIIHVDEAYPDELSMTLSCHNLKGVRSFFFFLLESFELFGVDVLHICFVRRRHWFHIPRACTVKPYVTLAKWNEHNDAERVHLVKRMVPAQENYQCRQILAKEKFT